MPKWHSKRSCCYEESREVNFKVVNTIIKSMVNQWLKLFKQTVSRCWTGRDVDATWPEKLVTISSKLGKGYDYIVIFLKRRRNKYLIQRE
jgi:hypothetical protein